MKDLFQTVRARWTVQAFREEIPAVDTAGLGRLLENAGIRDEFDRGEMECRFCGNSVDDTTVYALIKESGSVKAVCMQAVCVGRFILWIEGR